MVGVISGCSRRRGHRRHRANVPAVLGPDLCLWQLRRGPPCGVLVGYLYGLRELAAKPGFQLSEPFLMEHRHTRIRIGAASWPKEIKLGTQMGMGHPARQIDVFVQAQVA